MRNRDERGFVRFGRLELITGSRERASRSKMLAREGEKHVDTCSRYWRKREMLGSRRDMEGEP